LIGRLDVLLEENAALRAKCGELSPGRQQMRMASMQAFEDVEKLQVPENKSITHSLSELPDRSEMTKKGRPGLTTTGNQKNGEKNQKNNQKENENNQKDNENNRKYSENNLDIPSEKGRGQNSTKSFSK